MDKIEIKTRPYKVETELVQEAGAVEAHANEIIFINKSGAGVTVKIDGFPLDNNEFLFDGGHAAEWNNTRYAVTGSSASFRLFVRRKIYQ
jgi:hypothetical protein